MCSNSPHVNRGEGRESKIAYLYCKGERYVQGVEAVRVELAEMADIRWR